jgi:hypothetical protein
VDKAAKHERVLLLLPNLHIGGAQEVVRTLAKHLVSDGCTPLACLFTQSAWQYRADTVGRAVISLSQGVGVFHQRLDRDDWELTPRSHYLSR